MSVPFFPFLPWVYKFQYTHTACICMCLYVEVSGCFPMTLSIVFSNFWIFSSLIGEKTASWYSFNSHIFYEKSLTYFQVFKYYLHFIFLFFCSSLYWCFPLNFITPSILGMVTICQPGILQIFSPTVSLQKVYIEACSKYEIFILYVQWEDNLFINL